MKKTLFFLCAMCAILFASCSDDDSSKSGLTVEDIDGTYLLTEIDGLTIQYDAGYEPTFTVRGRDDMSGNISFDNIPNMSGSYYFTCTPTNDGCIKDGTIDWVETYVSGNTNKKVTVDHHANFSAIKQGKLLYWNSKGDKYNVKCKKQ